MNRSTAAFLIALMFHILLILLFMFLMQMKPEMQVKKPQEHRIKVALQEQPKSNKKSAPIKNKIKPREVIPPMPKGKQLDKITPPPKLKKQEKAVKPIKEMAKKPIKKTPKKPPTKAKKVVQTPKSKKKEPAYKHVEKFAKTEDVNITTKPVKKQSALMSFLSKKQKPIKKVKTSQQQSGSQIGRDFKEAYGEEFGKLSEGEKQYIIDNQEVMRRITQAELNRLGPVNIPRNINVNTMNIIEFYLYPNGDISDLKLITNSSREILDDTSLQTIEYSYHRYPLPKQKTLIRYKVGYYLAGRRH